MDVIGSLGYRGQELVFVDNTVFSYVTGKSVCLVDGAIGPRELLWRPRTGIKKILANIHSQQLAIVPLAPNYPIEILSSTDQQDLGGLSNPTNTCFEDAAFSRNGERLCALSDALDRKICVWNVSTHQLLLTADVLKLYTICSFNPADNNQIVVQGVDGVGTGTINDLVDYHAIKFQTVTCDIPTADFSALTTVQFTEADYAVQFMVWAPVNRFIIGTASGQLFEIESTTLRARGIGRLVVSVDEEVPVPARPVSAVLTQDNLVVGFVSGAIHWYSVDTLYSGTLDTILAPLQISSVRGSARTLVVDPLFEKIYIGSSAGVISKVIIEVKERIKASVEGEEEGGAVEEKAAVEDSVVSTVSPERVSSLQDGAVLCCTSLSVPIIGTSTAKIAKKSTNLLSMFVTGSHVGRVSFWKQPAFEAEPVAAHSHNGIRRSVPRAMKILSSVEVFESSTPCIVSTLPSYIKDGSCLLGIGTSKGWLEVLKLDAIETEDEEEEGGGDVDEFGTVDEDGVRLTVRPIARYRLFNSAISLMCKASDWDTKNMAHLIAVASYHDPRIFVLKEDEKDSFDLVMQLCLGTSPGISPTSMNWTGTSVCVCSGNGAVYSFLAKTLFASSAELDHKSIVELYPDQSWQTEAGNIVTGVYLPSKDYLLTVLADEPGVVCLKNSVSTSAPSVVISDDVSISNSSMSSSDSTAPTEISTLATLGAFGESIHMDVVICCATSPNGNYVAVGCADGTVFLWSVKSSVSKFEVAVRVNFHSEATISVSFSVDSSLLFCCGADGSMFVCAVDRASHIEYEFETSRHSVRARKFQTLTTPLIQIPTDAKKIWMVDKREQIIEAMKVQFSDKSMDLQSTLNALAVRLKTMLERNSGRTELEMLDRSEFIVDVPRRDSALVENQLMIMKIRDTYKLRGYWNELNAARIRTCCWDSMEVHSRSILPFVPENCGDVRYVSSFAVPKQTDYELQVLQRVKRLRAIEIRSQRAHGNGIIQRLPDGKTRACWAPVVQGFSSQVSWICGDGSRWPNADASSIFMARESQPDSKDVKKDAAAPDAAASSAAGAAVDDEDERSLNSQENIEIDENDVLNLLYAPQSIRTDVQKRSHIILLKEVIRLIKIRFNEHFEKLAREKEDVLASIESRNVRVQAILDDLGQVEEVPHPVIQDVEIAGSAVVVRDVEIKSRPFETEAMREARLREEEEAKKREAADDKKDALMRALEDMMHGTLEVKRNVLAEASSLVRPEWMTQLTQAEMSETQLKEFEAFEAKFKALQEEQATYRKQLEQELKKLKTEIVEVCKMFDEKLVAMAKIKVLTVRDVLTHELFVSRIANNIVRVEQARKNLKSFEASIDKARRDRVELRAKMDRFNQHCEETKAALSALQEDERQMDRNFKKDIQQAQVNATFDQQTLKKYTDMYRLRKYPSDEAEEDGDGGGLEPDSSNPEAKGWSKDRHSKEQSKGGSFRAKNRKSQQGNLGTLRSSSNTDGGGGAHNASKKVAGGGKLKASRGRSSAGGSSNMILGPMQEAAMALKNIEQAKHHLEKDPFYKALIKLEKQKKQAESQIPRLDPLSMDVDLEDGVIIDQVTFAKLQELRTARVEKEIAVKQTTIKFNDLRAKLDLMHAEEAALAGTINSLRSSRDEVVELLKHLNSDTEIIVALRQGQDEIDRDAIVTDYSDAMLVPVPVLNKFNSRIKELGKDKIGVLSKIKTFRRKINYVVWKAKHLSLESTHYAEYFTDLQLFRVTRELQHILREGSDANQTQERLDKVALRKDFMQKDAEAKFVKMKRSKEMLKKQLQERTEEINNLERKVKDLRGQVLARKSVRQSRDDARGSGDTVELTTQRMKKIVARRQLVDTAKAQAEEIDFLRQELDKVRQKTFPSFIRAVKKRLPNPDERI